MKTTYYKASNCYAILESLYLVLTYLPDEEMTVFSKGVPSFASLAVRDQQVNSIRIDYLSKTMPASYIVFDILYKDQESLMNLPLIDRKSILQQELQESDSVTIIEYLQSKVKPISKRPRRGV